MASTSQAAVPATLCLPIPTPYLPITGGYIFIDAQGDGCDSNGSVYVSGGTLIVNGPTGNMNGAIGLQRNLRGNRRFPDGGRQLRNVRVYQRFIHPGDLSVYLRVDTGGRYHDPHRNGSGRRDSHLCALEKLPKCRAVLVKPVVRNHLRGLLRRKLYWLGNGRIVCRRNVYRWNATRYRYDLVDRAIEFVREQQETITSNYNDNLPRCITITSKPIDLVNHSTTEPREKS